MSFATATGTGAGALDPSDVRLVHHAPRGLAPFNQAGVLVAADVHVALRLGRLGVESDETVLLAAALAVRAPRLGHVYADLATIHGTVTVDADRPVDLQALPWPEPAGWVERLAGSPVVAVGDDGPPGRPLRLVGSRLYLDRYWAEERQVAGELAARAARPLSGVDEALLEAGLARLFAGDESADQRRAAAGAVLRRLAVVAGGPGTGKTTTVARILALVDDQAAAAGDRSPLVALAAPTGKAAARAGTLHRLLGARPDSRSRFRHHRANRLPHDVIVVDETSMVSLSLMARLLEAVRGDARLVLVGDPQQLASVEAGAVLGDVVGPAADVAAAGPETRVAATPPSPVAASVVVLRRVHRFGGAIARLAEAVRVGDPDRVVDVLGEGSDDVTWLPVDVADPGAAATLAPVRAAAVDAGRALLTPARAGDARAALAALGQFRLLCAHRRGPHGVATWSAQVEHWLIGAVDGFAAQGHWYVGRPLLVTENDYGLRLYNGDTGVVIADPAAGAGASGAVAAVFERGTEPLRFSPTRLGAVETVHAMTVHKSQGSQFAVVAVLLPDPTSPILTRELLYTAVTRAQQRLILAATEESVRQAVTRPIARASGLRSRLWGNGPGRL